MHPLTCTRAHTHTYIQYLWGYGVMCEYTYIYLFIFILHHTPHPPTGCHFRRMLCFKKFFFFPHFSFCSRFKDMQSHHSSADGAGGSQREGERKRKREFSAFSIMKHLVEPWSHGFGSEKGWGWATGGGGGGWGGCFSSCHFTQKQLFEWGEHGKREWDIKKRDLLATFPGLFLPGSSSIANPTILPNQRLLLPLYSVYRVWLGADI